MSFSFPRGRPTFSAVAGGLLALCLLWAPIQPRASDSIPGFDSASSATDARFGARIGAASQWESQMGGTSKRPLLAFGGNVRVGCSGVDLNGFLHSFDPAELLAEIRSTLLNGAQAAASNYLITMAYANPTISSVLDMMDKRYTARFSAFAQACDAQAARARGLDRGSRAMAQAGDECFDAEVARGSAPSEAYRRCSISRNFDSAATPATSSTLDFLRRFTHVNVTPDMEALLGLLPDEKIEGGSYQMHPPQTTLASMSLRLHDQARLALDQLETGTAPESIPACDASALLGTAAAPAACLPAAARTLVSSPAFRGAQLLGPAARALFKDALSSQIAIGAMYAGLLELYQQTARMDVRPGSGADASHIDSRRRQMRESIADLLQEADTQVKAQNARSELVRMQMLALERVESDLDAGARRSRESARPVQYGMRGLLQVFSDAH